MPQFYQYSSYQIDVTKTKSLYMTCSSAPQNSKTEITLFYNFYCHFLRQMRLVTFSIIDANVVEREEKSIW